MHHREHLGQRRGFGRGERADRLVAVQQRVDGVQVRLGPAQVGQVEPGHGGPLQGVGQVVHGEGPVGQPEVEHPGHHRVRARRRPGQVGRVPVAVAPLPGQPGQQRRGPPDGGQHEPGQVVRPGPAVQVGGQPRAPAGQPLELRERVGRDDQLAAAGEHGRRAGRQREAVRREVQPGQRRPGRPRVAETGVRGPGHRVPVQIEAAGDLVHFVDEVAVLGGRRAVRGAQHRGCGDTARPQVADERVLHAQLGRRAHPDVVPLDEQVDAAAADQARRRHGPRAAPGDHLVVAGGPSQGGAGDTVRGGGREQGPEAGLGVAGQHRADLRAGQRAPVRLDQLLAHAVDQARGRGRTDHPAHRDPLAETGDGYTGRVPLGKNESRRARDGTAGSVALATGSSLRRHYPVRFRRSVARDPVGQPPSQPGQPELPCGCLMLPLSHGYF